MKLVCFACACAVLVLVGCATATPSSSPTPTPTPTPTTAPASAPDAAAAPMSSDEVESLVARTGCLRALSAQNAEAYAARAQADGVNADAARAEAQFVMSRLEGVFGDVCDCSFNALGGWTAIKRESGAAGVEVDAWIRERLTTPAVQAQIAPCAQRVMRDIEPKMRLLQPEVEAFRASQAGATAATPVPAAPAP